MFYYPIWSWFLYICSPVIVGHNTRDRNPADARREADVSRNPCVRQGKTGLGKDGSLHRDARIRSYLTYYESTRVFFSSTLAVARISAVLFTFRPRPPYVAKMLLFTRDHIIRSTSLTLNISNLLILIVDLLELLIFIVRLVPMCFPLESGLHLFLASKWPSVPFFGRCPAKNGNIMVVSVWS